MVLDYALFMAGAVWMGVALSVCNFSFRDWEAWVLNTPYWLIGAWLLWR